MNFYLAGAVTPVDGIFTLLNLALRPQKMITEAILLSYQQVSRNVSTRETVRWLFAPQKIVATCTALAPVTDAMAGVIQFHEALQGAIFKSRRWQIGGSD